MKTAINVIVLLTALLLSHAAGAEPTRDSLVAAWEEHVRDLPGTSSFEKTGDGTYHYSDTDLPYDGALRIQGALVRSVESPGFETEFSHIGMVEFELADLPAERLSSQVYYFWLADRQTLYFSEATQEWVDTGVYQDAIANWYPDTPSYGVLTFMVNYGIWIILAVVLIFAFIAVGRQTRKAQALMDDSAALNERGRENLDRAEKMQDEVLAIARESRDLQAESNRLLRKILDSLQR